MGILILLYTAYCIYEAYKADTISIKILFTIAATLLTTVGIAAAVIL